jgi:hypothetical protein
MRPQVWNGLPDGIGERGQRMRAPIDTFVGGDQKSGLVRGKQKLDQRSHPVPVVLRVRAGAGKAQEGLFLVFFLDAGDVVGAAGEELLRPDRRGFVQPVVRGLEVGARQGVARIVEVLHEVEEFVTGGDRQGLGAGREELRIELEGMAVQFHLPAALAGQTSPGLVSLQAPFPVSRGADPTNDISPRIGSA